jgi:hypothetical protein
MKAWMVFVLLVALLGSIFTFRNFGSAALLMAVVSVTLGVIWAVQRKKETRAR